MKTFEVLGAVTVKTLEVLVAVIMKIFILEYDVIQLGKSLPLFRSNFLPPYSG
jgi:hypothetical protein